MNSTPQTFEETNEKIALSIVIVNHNTKRLLQQCLSSIYETIDNLNFELFVVDNASSDGSVEMVRSQFPQVNLIANSVGLGFAKAANIALAKGVGDYFLISHPDIEYLPDAVQTMYAFLKNHSKAGIVGANLVYPDGSYNPCMMKMHSMQQDIVEFTWIVFRSFIKLSPWIYKKFKSVQDSYYWDHEKTAQSDMIWNACMMFRKEVLETIDKFYEGFYIWFADTDWCFRAKNAGWQMYYLHDAKVVHYEKQSANFIESQEVRYKVRPALVQPALNKDRYTFLKRNYKRPTLWLRKFFDVTSLWITYLKLTLLRIFAPSRYHTTLDMTR